MAVNTDKTKYLIFHTKGKKIDLNGKKLVFDNNDPLKPFNPSLVHELERIHDNHDNPSSRSYKLLGILFDEHLNFNHHINHLKSKLSKVLYCKNRIKNFVSQKALKTIYFSLFHSHLLYCLQIVNCSSKSNIEKIFTVQKRPYAALQTQNIMPILNPSFHHSKSSHTIKSSTKPNWPFFIPFTINMPHPPSLPLGNLTLIEILPMS